MTARPVPAWSWAFQPIVDVADGSVYSFEALVRGPAGEPASTVLAAAATADPYAFDEELRASAIETAARLGLVTRLNLNVLPRGLVASQTPLASTIAAAGRNGIDAARLIIEVTEGELVEDVASLAARLDEYRRFGVSIAIDDFGAGHAGLTMLADLLPDVLKLDRALVHGIEGNGARQAIVRAVLQFCLDLGIDVIAEGVETVAERHWLEDAGIRLFQGYLFGRPTFEALAPPEWPTRDAQAA